MVRKIKKEYENPIDNILYDLCEIISPTFYKFGFVPNTITFLSFITTLVSLNYYNFEQNIQGSIFLIISYFFDCLDGYFARKYNMISKFGDYLDHGTDFFLALGLIYMFYKKNSYDIFKQKMIILSILGLLSLIHLGCQEKIYDKNDSFTLSFTKLFSPSKKNCFKLIKYTRYFGLGTMILVISSSFLF
jgi:cardiolipin synthase